MNPTRPPDENLRPGAALASADGKTDARNLSIHPPCSPEPSRGAITPVGHIGHCGSPSESAEDSRTPKRKRMAKLLECGCPLPLFSVMPMLTDSFNRTHLLAS